MTKIEEKINNQHERVFKKWKLNVLASWCDKAEQAIAKEENLEQKARMEKIFKQAERIFNNRMTQAEDSLMDRN
jgi:hypothetical protein